MIKGRERTATTAADDGPEWIVATFGPVHVLFFSTDRTMPRHSPREEELKQQVLLLWSVSPLKRMVSFCRAAALLSGLNPAAHVQMNSVESRQPTNQPSGACYFNGAAGWRRRGQY